MAAKKRNSPHRVNKAGKAAAKSPRARQASRKAASTARNAEALRSFIRTKGLQYLNDPNVTSVGIGEQDDGSPCIEFTVAQKASSPEGLEALGTEEIPKTVTIAGEQVPTKVTQRTYKPSFEVVEVQKKDYRKRRLDTLVPGVSVSHPAGTAGTLGAIVYDVHSGAACMLSNWHVLHGGSGKLGDRVVQPGPFDDDRVSQNEAGVLLRSHLGAAGDCAIARIDGRAFGPTVYELNTSIRRVARPHLGDIVIKSGRTTGVTHGVVKRVDVVAKIDYDGVGPQKVGGFEIRPAKGAPENYEVSMGGDSGSAWLVAEKSRSKIVATDVMVGLHFAGETDASDDEHALACYADSVFEKLEVRLEPPAPEAVREAGDRPGYDPLFLGVRVDVPSLPGRKGGDAVTYAGKKLIPYTHFSVCMSESRRLAHFVAWMIDGEQLKSYGRKGLKFRLDPRIPEDLQLGDELYAANKLDRGHIARRADLVWGPKAEAQRANADSFYFTNITPQHQAFNQSERGGLWGQLENAVFEEADVLRLRVSLIGGPIFKDDDPEYREVPIPRSFFKVLAYRDEATEELVTRAYVLTQRDLLNDIEAFDLDPFRLYQVSLAELETIAGLRFAKALKDADTFRSLRRPEGVGREAREITARAEIVR